VVRGTPGQLASCPICATQAAVVWDDLYDDRYGYPGAFTLQACASCGHRFIAAGFTDAELRSLYGSHYPRGLLSLDEFRPYVEVRGFRAWLQGERASAFRWVPTGVRVLDVGCGFGETLAYHQARGCDAHGVEADENILRVAERYGLKARAGLFDPADYAPESFDYVTLDQVIEHAISPRDLLSGVAAVLRPGGFAVLSTPYSRGFGARVFRRRWINWHVPYHLHQFSRRSLRITAHDAGLSVVSLRTVTNSAWLGYQVAHLLSCPPPGEASPFWDPARSARSMPRGANRLGAFLERAMVLHLITRIADGLAIGDNLLCVLQKPR
jgi:2-polyprenyl-3-methyl-5-hydroxy-6-metoxy-1,4-benzoquinol methylase